MKINRHPYPWLLAALLITVISCKKEEKTDPPGTPNSAPSAITFISAPAQGGTDISSPLSISWTAASDPDGDSITYNVYLGTNSSNLTLVSNSQAGLTYISEVLELGETYYLRVDAKAGTHTTPSETRNFTTSNSGMFADSRDGQSYGTIKIGTQIWMTENLKYNSTGSYSYNNSPSNDANYGRLYEWAYVSMAVPSGWHLPTDSEWQTLETLLGMPSSDLNINNYGTPRGTDQGTQLKQGGSSGLNFPLAGFRSGGTYSALNNRTYLWVDTDAGGGNIFRRRLVTSDPSCYRFTNPTAGFAISVRLIKD